MNKIIGAIGIITVICIGTINIFSDYLVFNPPKLNYEYLADIQKKKLKLFKINSNDISLSVLHIEPNIKKTNKIIIFSHGNGSDIFENIDYLCKKSNLYGISIVVYDYCGYGLTSGIKSEENCTKCLDMVIKHYTENIGFNYNDIILVGYSIGTAVTIDYVSKNNWQNEIILIAPFKTIARVLFDSFILDLINFKYPFLTIHKLKNIICPIKIIHGKNDELISVNHSVDLYNSLKNKKYNVLLVDNCDHKTILDHLLKDKINDIENILS
jgi:predicted esterase